jgi:hypothetical protein
MPIAKVINIAPVAGVANDIATSQTVASATTLNLNGAKAGTSLDYARQIAIASTSNIAAIVFTVVGTDANDRAQTDTVTGINNNSVSTTKYFKTVSSVATSATLGGANVTVGTSASLATKIQPLNDYSAVPAQITIEGVSGTSTYSVQETYSDLSGTTGSEIWITPTALSAKSTSANVAITAPLDARARACRLVTTAISSANINFIISQSDEK